MPYAPIPCERVIHVSALFTLYDFRFATGYVFRGESHPFWEMVYVGDGAVDIGAQLPPPMALRMATIICAMLPIMCVYPFLQKHFAKGVLIGAVKE